MTDANELRALDARALFEVSRPCFHYAPRGTPDGGMFERSETGRLLMKAMERIAALIASREAAVKPLGYTNPLVAGHPDEQTVNEAVDGLCSRFPEWSPSSSQLGFAKALAAEALARRPAILLDRIETLTRELDKAREALKPFSLNQVVSNADFRRAADTFAALSATTDLGRDTENAG